MLNPISSNSTISHKVYNPWWRHHMETFSALLVICAGNSPVPGEFPTQRPVTRSFDVYFDLRPNKRLSKQSLGWWFETLSPPLWRHRNDRQDLALNHPYYFEMWQAAVLLKRSKRLCYSEHQYVAFRIERAVLCDIEIVPGASKLLNIMNFSSFWDDS